MNKQQQQGDVLLRYVEQVPEGSTVIKAISGRFILAEGEATGHAHAIVATDDCQLYEHEGTLYLHVKQPVELTHEEHHSQVLDPGIIQVGIVQEYDYLNEMVREVVD